MIRKSKVEVKDQFKIPSISPHLANHHNKLARHGYLIITQRTSAKLSYLYAAQGDWPRSAI